MSHWRGESTEHQTIFSVKSSTKPSYDLKTSEETDDVWWTYRKMAQIKSIHADLLFFVLEIKQKSPPNIFIDQAWRWKRQKMYFTMATLHWNTRFLLHFRSARGFLTKPPAKLSFLLVQRPDLSALTSHSPLPQVLTDAEIAQFCWRELLPGCSLVVRTGLP